MQAQTLAGLFAAKEAFFKAMGTGICTALTEVEILHTPEGQPCYRLRDKAGNLAAGWTLCLSITHEEGMAAAVCSAIREAPAGGKESTP